MSIPRVIIVIASSLDGRIAFPGGGESHLGSDEDKKILNQNLQNINFNEPEIFKHINIYLTKRNLNNNFVSFLP